jgi:hypothetical protein
MNGCTDMRHSHNKGRATGPVDERNSVAFQDCIGGSYGVKDARRTEMFKDIGVFAPRQKRIDCLLQTILGPLLSSHPQGATR